MEYIDFELRVTPRDDGAYAIALGESTVTASMRLPWDPGALRHRLALLQHVVLKRGHPATTSPYDDGSFEEFGRTLFRTLMPDATVAAYRQAQRRARLEGKGLRLRLRLGSPELATVPWELLYDPDDEDYVCLSAATPLVRQLEVDRVTQALRVRLPLSILVMAAAPVDRPTLDIAGERQRMGDALLAHQRDGLVRVEWLPDGSWRSLQTAMQRGPFHVLHFIGHGAFDERAGEGTLTFEDEQGRSEPCSATELARLLADHFPLRLVVLNACMGARSAGDDLFSSTSSVLVRRGVPAVVAMQQEISDGAALEFSRSFYGSLANGKPADESVAEARKAISLASRGSAEWATPVLHLQSPDGELFEFDAAPEITAPVRVPRTLDETALRSRQALLDDVVTEIRGRLMQMLGPDGDTSVSFESVPDRVARPWDADVKLGRLDDDVGGTDLVQAFEQEATAGKLLILGTPGGGKTYALLQIAESLHRRAQASIEEPIPLIVNLASWTDSAKHFDEWLLTELRAKYGIHKRYGLALLADRDMAPCFDGLDELPVDRHRTAVVAINAFVREHRPRRVVVCCREAEYANVPEKLELGGAIRLAPLSDEQIQAYLAGASALDMWATLRSDPALLSVARCPLFLRLLVVAHDRLSPMEWAAREPPARLSLLFDTYLQRLLTGAPAKARYPEDRTLAWLRNTALALRDVGSDELLLERMSLAWLGTARGLWAYRIVTCVLASLIVGLVLVVQYTLPEVPTDALGRALAAANTEPWLKAYVPLLDLLMSASYGLWLAVQTHIRPFETVRWSAVRAKEGLVASWRWLSQWALRVGLVAGWGTALWTASIPGSGTGIIRTLGWGAGTVLSLVVTTALLWAGRSAHSAGSDRESALPSDARLILCSQMLAALAVAISFGWDADALALAVFVIPVWACLAYSRLLTRTAMSIVAKCVAISGVAALGLIPALKPDSWRTFLLLWWQGAAGAGALTGVLAAVFWHMRPRGQAREVPIPGGHLTDAGAITAKTSRRHVALGLAGAGLLWVASLASGAVGFAGPFNAAIRGAAFAQLSLMEHLSLMSGATALLLVSALFWVPTVAIGGLVRGAAGPDIEQRNRPNQGIRNSSANVAVFFAAAAIAVGVPWGLTFIGIVAMWTGTYPDSADFINVLPVFSYVCGVLAALAPAAACIQHFALRFVLWCNGTIPWRYVEFLDYATERMLLQRIGGRYRFIHSLLRDHLADRGVARPGSV